jgi:hypothetical protein
MRFVRLAAALSALAIVGVSGVASAGPERSFNAFAASDGVRVTLSVPNGPVTDTPVDGGGPSAQAVLNSTGESRAFASAPYPGDAAVALPGTLAGFGVAGLPAYPFYATSSFPQAPKSEVGQGPFVLKAESTYDASQGSAVLGAATEQAGSEVTASASSARMPDGRVVAGSEASAQAVSLGAVHIASLVSRSQVTRAADGSLSRASDLRIEGLSAGDVGLEVRDGRLQLAGQPVPVDSAAVAKALAGMGITIEYLRAEEFPTGIVGAGLRISVPVGSQGEGPRLTYTLGRSSAAIATGAEVPIETVPVGAAPEVVDPGSGSSPAPAASPPAAGPDSAAATELAIPPFEVPTSLPSPESAPSRATPPPEGVVAAPSEPPAPNASPSAEVSLGAAPGASGVPISDREDFTDLYLYAIAAAAAAVVITHVVRIKARSSWAG